MNNRIKLKRRLRKNLTSFPLQKVGEQVAIRAGHTELFPFSLLIFLSNISPFWVSVAVAMDRIPAFHYPPTIIVYKMIPIELILGALALLYFTYVDYKTKEIENYPILVFLLLGLSFSLTQHQFVLNLILMLLMFGMCYYLWNKGAIGGADVKILPGIIPFLGLSGFGASIAGLIVFLVFFAIIGGIYGLLCKFILKGKEVPFLPAVTLTFLVFWVMYKGVSL